MTYEKGNIFFYPRLLSGRLTALRLLLHHASRSLYTRLAVSQSVCLSISAAGNVSRNVFDAWKKLVGLKQLKLVGPIDQLRSLAAAWSIQDYLHPNQRMTLPDYAKLSFFLSFFLSDSSLVFSALAQCSTGSINVFTTFQRTLKRGTYNSRYSGIDPIDRPLLSAITALLMRNTTK